MPISMIRSFSIHVPVVSRSSTISGFASFMKTTFLQFYENNLTAMR